MEALIGPGMGPASRGARTIQRVGGRATPRVARELCGRARLALGGMGAGGQIRPPPRCRAIPRRACASACATEAGSRTGCPAPVTKLEAALLELTSFLEEEHHPYMVIGGFANLHWGVRRFTEDIDLTVQAGDEAVPGWIDQLAKRYAMRVHDPL